MLASSETLLLRHVLYVLVGAFDELFLFSLGIRVCPINIPDLAFSSEHLGNLLRHDLSNENLSYPASGSYVEMNRAPVNAKLHCNPHDFPAVIFVVLLNSIYLLLGEFVVAILWFSHVYAWSVRY